MRGVLLSKHWGYCSHLNVRRRIRRFVSDKVFTSYSLDLAYHLRCLNQLFLTRRGQYVGEEKSSRTAFV